MIDSNILNYSCLEPLNVSRETFQDLEKFRQIIIEKNNSDNTIDSLLREKNYNVIPLPFEYDISGMSPRSSIGAVDAIFIDDNGKVSGGADYRGDDFAAKLK